MATTHEWFGTTGDADLVIDWLRNAGAKLISGSPLEGEWESDGRELGLHFPAIGPVEYWPEEIRLADYPENSTRWRHAALAMIDRESEPHKGLIDCDRSAVAGLQLPEFRDGRYWVAAKVWFPTSRLREEFPELSRICQRFERFLRKHPPVFDNTKGADTYGFGDQICTASIIHKVVALPEAYDLLKGGAFMVENLASPGQYSSFRRRLQLAGYET